MELEAPMASTQCLEQAARILREGGIGAFPTETVYGLGADATNPSAIARIFAVKRRPSTHPLIVHLPGIECLEAWAAEVPPAARLLAERYWPGPLSLVLRRSDHVQLAVTGGLETVALRVPSHPAGLALIRTFGGGVAAPSANRFGSISPTTARHVQEDLGTAIDFVIDGGPCEVGVESTIIDLSRDQPTILRPGGVTHEEIEATLGMVVSIPGDGADSGVRVPGQLPSHYAPRARVVLTEPQDVAEEARRRRAQGYRVGTLVRAGWKSGSGAGDLTLRVPESTADFARAVYALLREFDRLRCDFIVTSVPLEEGLGCAIADRLRRAAGPREDPFSP